MLHDEENKKLDDLDKNEDESVISDDGLDIEFEYTNANDECAKKIKKLKAKLKKCEEEKREYLDGWQRLKADVLNEKKKEEDKNKQLKKKVTEDMLQKLVPVLDSFDMAFSDSSWKDLDEKWRQGVEFIHKQFQDFLQAFGVETYAQDGDKFDPSFHEVIKEEETDDESKDGKISKVLRKGYKIDGFVLRPAQVVVFVYKSK